MVLPDRFSTLPGADLVEAGLRDLASGRSSQEAVLVLVGATRLRRLGLPVPQRRVACPEHELYRLLHDQDQDSAHSRYNALIRRLVSFERAAECAA
jgi:hypothetical protein